jgi:D-alanyl-D-alanine carboxypeptidase
VHPHPVVHGRNYHPPYAAIVVDVNSGEVLHEANCDEPRYPASLTKIMTLYLLFEQLQSGQLKLDSQLPISAHAAVQAPTKLGLRAGSTLKVEDAIYGIVTRSANDAAVVVAEAVGGTEDDFARLMTRKARALGMMNTVYVNASGLPADAQLTTARDQAVLGRAIQTRFPEHYGYSQHRASSTADGRSRITTSYSVLSRASTASRPDTPRRRAIISSRRCAATKGTCGRARRNLQRCA